jgi:hypothetical protein
MISLRRLPLLAALLLLPVLAGCGGAPPANERVLGARGTVVDSVRGAPAADGVLRPEPGNIWTEGLEPARVQPGR